MIRSRSELDEATERVLCEEFLLPLFRAMGYKDVVYYHGGTLEQGKDIVMWKSGDFSPRVNYAVVAKAKRVTGNVSVQSEVLHQIKQALATSFNDATTAESQRVTRVLVASNKDITKEALASLDPLLDKEGLSGRTEFLGVDRLWELAEKHLMPWLIGDSLARARIGLLELDPNYRADVNLTAEGVRYTILPKHQEASPITINAQPDFPDDEEGERQRLAFNEFLRTGDAVSIEQDYLPLVEPPPILKFLMPSSVTGPVELFMPPREPQTVMIWRIIAKADNRESEIPYVHFTTLRGGFVKMGFSNDDQPVPLRIELDIDKETWECRLRYSLAREDVPLYWVLLYHEFLSTLAEGASIEVEDLYSGIRSTLLRTEPGQVSGPPPALLDFLCRAHAIETRTGQGILVHDPSDISDDAVRSVGLAERVLDTGRISDGSITICASVQTEESVLRELLSLNERGGGKVQFSRQSQSLPVLGTPIDFGPTRITFDKGLIHEEDVSRLKQFEAEGSVTVPVRFVCAPGTQAEVLFDRWLSSSDNKLS